MTLGEIRRRPTLPGRFQPSTISVLRLNFCVRDGNRWIPQAIVTGNMGLSRWCAPASPSLVFWLRFALSRAASLCSASLRICSFDSLRCACPFLAPSKPHRFGSLWPTDHVRLRSPLTFTLCFGFAHAPPPFRFSQIFPGRVSVSGPFPALRARFRLHFGFGSRFRLFLFPVPFSLFPFLSPRSSPRPISIIKLHTLPHFHR